MKIVFLYPIFESLGIEYLSAYLKKYGHQTELVSDPLLFSSYCSITSKSLHRIFNYKRIILDKVVASAPDLICISCVSDYFSWAIKIAEDIKGILNVPLVFGGPHSTAVPENVLKYPFVDFVIVGEGEGALLELVNSIENKRSASNIQNLCFKSCGKVIKNHLRPLVSDLDSLPFPDKELYYRSSNSFINFIGSDSYTIMASRGCPYSCSYCHNSYLREIYRDSEYLRLRSADNIIEELLTAKQKYKIKRVAFCDDAFIYYGSKGWLKELLEKYKKKIALPFYCCVHPSSIDEDTVNLLADAGCRTIHMGIQNFNENTRKNILLRYGSNEEIIRAIKLISKKNMFLWVDIIVGLPKETEEDLLDIACFFNKYKVDAIGMIWLRHYPKSEITKYLDAETVKRINDGIIYAPVTSTGTTFDKNKITLINLTLLANIVHHSFLKFILKNKLYRFFPKIYLHYANLVFSAILAKISAPKKFVYPRWRMLIDQLRYNEYYISKYFFEILKRFKKNQYC